MVADARLGINLVVLIPGESYDKEEMRAGLDAIKMATRVLAALSAKQEPDPADIQALREYDDSTNGQDLEELACDVIQMALRHRAAMRAAGAR